MHYYLYPNGGQAKYLALALDFLNAAYAKSTPNANASSTSAGGGIVIHLLMMQANTL